MLRLSPFLYSQLRLYSFRSPRFNPQQYVATEFEKKWRNMSEQDRHDLEGTFKELERGDWKLLTKDQIRNSFISCFNASLYNLLWRTGD